jgi:antitoxin ParD1/3/4
LSKPCHLANYEPISMRHINLPDELVRLAEAQVAAGRAASIEDVLRAGVEVLEVRDQRRYDEKLAALRAAIDEGDASGVYEGDPFAHVRAKYDLPPASR